MVETASGLAGSFEYNTDLFDAVTVAGMATHLVTLLDAIVADPNRRVLDIPLAVETQDFDAPVLQNPEAHEFQVDDKFTFELSQ